MKTKLVALLMAVGVALSGVGASLGAYAQSTQAVSAPVTVTMFAAPSSDVQNLDTNWFTKYVEKRFNIKIKWSIATSSDATTKQQLLLASGNYPDMFWSGSFSNSELLKYGHQGVLVPLNKYIQQYAPNVEKAMKEFPGLKQDMVAPDGNIYSIPAINYCWHCYWSSKVWINTKWLKQLHLKMPTTTDQFFKVLQALKAGHPGGVKNVIALDGDIDGWHSDVVTFLMNAFIYTDGDVITQSPAGHFFIQNGKVVFAPIQPQWQQGLEYIHKLYAAGLISPQAFTQHVDQVKSQVQQGQVAAFAEGASNDIINYGAPGSDYQYWWVVPPLKGPKGVNYAAFYGQGPSGGTFAVTNKTTPAQIAAVMKLINFVFTVKGTTMLDFGPEGKYWTPAKPGQKGLTGGQALLNIDWNKFYNGTALQNWGWNQMGPMYQSQAWREGGVAEPEFSPNGSQTLLQDMTAQYYAGHQPRYVYPAAAWVPASEVQQYQMLQTNINNFVSQWTAQFVTGHKDITKDWATYVQGVQNLGLKQYLQMAQSAMGKPFDTSAFKGQGLGH
jgi:putative aldouronate transport system substrate-binding protein